MYLTLLQEANLDGSYLMRMDENRIDSSQQKTHWKTIKIMERHKAVQGCGYPRNDSGTHRGGNERPLRHHNRHFVCMVGRWCCSHCDKDIDLLVYQVTQK